MPLSAASTKSLNARVQNVSGFINTHEADALLSLAYTLAERRTHFNTRQFLIVNSSAGQDSVKESARQIAESTNEDGLFNSNPPPFGFVFTGQGSQYVNSRYP